jgi:murein DD-endopeptidase MepM/ murein hydrolase activator NlpD
VSFGAPRQAGRLRLPVAVALAALLAALAAALAPARTASGASLQERLDATEAKIDRAEQAQGVLTTRIEALSDRIGRLEGEVAVLRRHEAAVAARLAAKQEELDRAVAKLSRAHDHLELVRARLRRALVQLREMLVAVYQAGAPDVVSVILASDGFDDLVERSEYLQRIQAQDEATIARVRELRDEVKRTVRRLKVAKLTIERARDAIALQKQRVARARGAVEARQAKLVAARGERQAVLDRVESHVHHLEGVEADLQAEMQARIAAQTGGVALPAGPVPPASAAGLIWPVDGILTSGFGMRWGRMHEGIDISVPEGTPIRAAASGTVILAAYSGGYGNYTCIDHGGGLSTCYGHQSGYAVSAGEGVVQGETIGYSGNTGSSTGPHLHFEVRVNGVAVDPLGYL